MDNWSQLSQVELAAPTYKMLLRTQQREVGFRWVQKKATGFWTGIDVGLGRKCQSSLSNACLQSTDIERKAATVHTLLNRLRHSWHYSYSETFTKLNYDKQSCIYRLYRKMCGLGWPGSIDRWHTWMAQPTIVL